MALSFHRLRKKFILGWGHVVNSILMRTDISSMKHGQKAASQKPIPLYQISIDHPQKDNFHNLVFGNGIDKKPIL
jgi:hypothetical protein